MGVGKIEGKAKRKGGEFEKWEIFNWDRSFDVSEKNNKKTMKGIFLGLNKEMVLQEHH